MATYFVIGASGYIGTHIVKQLICHRNAVKALSRSEASDQFLTGLGAEVIRGDIEDCTALETASSASDGVIYAARYMADELGALQAIANSLGNANRPLLFISGASVGAEQTAGGSGTFQFAEDTALLSPPKGSAVRLISEKFVRTAKNIRGFVIRPPLVFGAGASVQIPLLATKGRELGHVPYIGAGENLWGFVHVEDLAQLALNALQKGVEGSVYHAVTGEVAFRDLTHAIGEVLKKPARSVSLLEAEVIFGKFAARVMLGSSCRPTSQKTRAALDWTPKETSVLEDVRFGSYRAAWT